MSNLKLNFGTATHIGLVRKENQDRFGIVSSPESSTGSNFSFLAAVADGMGGHRGGAVAAEIAIKAVETTALVFPSEPVKALRELFVHAHREMAQCIVQNPLLREMGSTLSVALFYNGSVHTAHIGDSRIYQIRDKRLRQLSEDHSLVQELVRSQVITPQMAERHPDRNVITRALSGHSFALPDIYEPIPVQAEDIFLLCTDGLWGMVKDSEMNKLMLMHPPQKAADKLVEAALNQGGADNIAVVVIRFE